jgi:hypothetical protein
MTHLPHHNLNSGIVHSRPVVSLDKDKPQFILSSESDYDLDEQLEHLDDSSAMLHLLWSAVSQKLPLYAMVLLMLPNQRVVIQRA